ncbi:unnamed protein product [Trichobilharzia szidati]|nr:unnamed protein product [Trichobilharzia szidati]
MSKKKAPKMPRKKDSVPDRKTPKTSSAKVVVSNEEVTVVSEFVRDFVRRHVITSRRHQSDLFWRPGSNNSYNINLLPQPTEIIKRKKWDKFASDDDCHWTTVKHPVVKGGVEKKKQRKSLLKSIMNMPSTVSSDLPLKLHNLWKGYFGSVVNTSQLTGMMNNSHAGVVNNLETILRLNLIGAKLKVLRSKSCRAGVEGIVVMETKNTFSLASSTSSKELSASSSSCAAAPATVPLIIVPKIGSLFHLIVSKIGQCRNAEILLNGDCLAHRTVDRAIRKWRYTPTTAYEYNQNALTTEVLFSDVLIDGKITG